MSGFTQPPQPPLPPASSSSDGGSTDEPPPVPALPPLPSEAEEESCWGTLALVRPLAARAEGPRGLIFGSGRRW